MSFIWPRLKKIAVFSLLILTSCNYIVGEAWFVFLDVLLGTFVSFFLYFCTQVINMVHVYFKWHVFVIYLFLMPQPELPMVISSVVSLPVWFGGSLTDFLVPLVIVKLVFNSQNFFIHVLSVVFAFGLFCRYMDGIMSVYMSIPLSLYSDVCSSLHPYVYWCICTSVVMFVHLLVHQYLH